MVPNSPDSAPLAAPGQADERVDPQAVQAALRRLARGPGAPWLHEEVARRMAERLQVIRMRPARVLHWWGWLGGGATALRAVYPQAQWQAVEPTAALRARSDAAAGPPARWWQPLRRRAPSAWAEDEVPEASCELLWANMVLHASADPAEVIARWHRALAVDGFLMFSCLGPDTLKELRALYRAEGWAPPAQRFVDMHDLGDLLVQAGFADPVMDQEPLRLSWPDATAMLAELRGLGGNGARGRHAGLRTPRWRARLQRMLEGDDGKSCGADGASEAGRDGDPASDRAARPAATFEIVYGHAFKPAPRLRVEPESTVSLDEMRRQLRGGAAPSQGHPGNSPRSRRS